MRPSRRGLFGWFAALAVAPAAFARKPTSYAIGGLVEPGPLPLVGEIPSDALSYYDLARPALMLYPTLTPLRRTAITPRNPMKASLVALALWLAFAPCGTLANAQTIYGIGASSQPSSIVAQAGQSITGPALVNVSTSFKVVYANAATGLPANGYVIASVANNAYGTVYFSGIITGLSGLSPGPVFSSYSSAGGVTQTPPSSGSGDYSQVIGFALSATTAFFQPGAVNGPL